MSNRHTSSASVLEHAALGLAALGLVAMQSFPAMRGVSESFGWLPFWLLALPLTAWAVARGLHARGRTIDVQPQATVHRLFPQARRPVSARDSQPKQAQRRAA